MKKYYFVLNPTDENIQDIMETAYNNLRKEEVLIRPKGFRPVEQVLAAKKKYGVGAGAGAGSGAGAGAQAKPKKARKPMSEAHKAKIKKGVQSYHAKCKKGMALLAKQRYSK